MNSQYLKKKKLPDAPGVYFFRKGNKTLYIGRATSLRDRTRSYFSVNLDETRGPLIVEMVEKADNIKFQKTDSVLEAIILEVNLIKKYQPFYNTEEKDDKSFNYVLITKEDFPQILVTRGRDLSQKIDKLKQLKAIFGPFPSGTLLNEAVRFIRKIFPYRDEKCRAGGGKPCFNRHIGLCPGVCIGEVSKKDYAKTVGYIEQMFRGRKKIAIRGLEKEMKEFARKQDFEKAVEIRNKISALKHIRDVAFIKKDQCDYSNVLKNTRINKGDKVNEESLRMEAYDVAHLSGKNTRGVMVVMKDGEISKSGYRVFKVKTAKKADDVGALIEILTRRFKHREWQFPDVAVIDGGLGQLNAAKSIITKFSPKTVIVSVVKDERHKPREILGNSKGLREDNIFRLNAEAHRFAIGRLRRSMRKNWLT